MDKDNERILLANVIGECIKSLQLDKNINQKELALLSGVSERSLRRIERGQVNVNCTSQQILDTNHKKIYNKKLSVSQISVRNATCDIELASDSLTNKLDAVH